MSARLTDATLALILAWLGWGVVSIFAAPLIGVPLGLAMGAGAIFYLRGSMALRGLVAVLEPMGIVLPILILRHMLGALGVPFEPFGGLELFFFLLVYLPFLLCAFDLLPFDPYRVGYRALPVAGVALAICLYALLSGHWVLALIAVAGQGLWVFKLGSSNYFDHVVHVSLVPVAFVLLIVRMIGL